MEGTRRVFDRIRESLSSSAIAALLCVGLCAAPRTASTAEQTFSSTGCNELAKDAAENANEGSKKAADLAAVGYALMGVMIAAQIAAVAACSTPPYAQCSVAQAAAIAATGAYMAFSMANGDPASNTANSSGLADNAATNAENGKKCEGNTGNPAPAPDLKPPGGPGTTPGGKLPTCSVLASAGLNNPACPGGSANNEIRNTLGELRTALNDPNFQPPEGMTREQIEQQINDGEKALDGFGNPDSAFGSLGAGKAGDINGGRAGGKTGSGGAGASSGLGMDDGFGSKVKAGPDNRKGLGKASIKNGLTMIDDETGQELTIWERATRRYQGGPEGRRALSLARMEWMRQEAAKGAKKPVLATTTPVKPAPAPASASYGELGPLAPLTTAATPPAGAVKSAVPNEASVRPASVPHKNAK
jgi:hypothetical protein